MINKWFISAHEFGTCRKNAHREFEASKYIRRLTRLDKLNCMNFNAMDQSFHYVVSTSSFSSLYQSWMCCVNEFNSSALENECYFHLFCGYLAFYVYQNMIISKINRLLNYTHTRLLIILHSFCKNSIHFNNVWTFVEMMKTSIYSQFVNNNIIVCTIFRHLLSTWTHLVKISKLVDSRKHEAMIFFSFCSISLYYIIFKISIHG